MFPQQVGAMWFLAGAHMTQGNPRPAISILENLISLYGRREDSALGFEDLVIAPEAILEALGKCFAAIGSWERASFAFASALAQNSDLVGLPDRLVDSLEKLARPDLAIRVLRIVKDGGTRDTRVLCYLAMNEYQKNHCADALETLERVLVVDPLNPVALSWKALWSLRTKDVATTDSVLRFAREHDVTTEDLDRCAFELALAEEHFADALAKLEGIEHLYSPQDFEALTLKVSRLAKRESSMS